MTKVVEYFKKLSKVPTIVWGLSIVVTYFFANSFTIIAGSNEYITLLNQQLTELGFNYAEILPRLRITYCILEPLFAWAIFELILGVIYRSIYLRRQINSNSTFFKQTARIIYCAANIIVGLYSVSNFWVPEMQLVGSLILNFIVYTIAFTLMHSIYSWSVIKPIAIYDSFMRLFTVYFILYGALAAIGMIVALVTEGMGVLSIVLKCVRFAVIIASAVGVYFIYGKKLRKRVIGYVASASADNDSPKNGDGGSGSDFDSVFGQKTEQNKAEPDKPDDIFKGFGF